MHYTQTEREAGQRWNKNNPFTLSFCGVFWLLKYPLFLLFIIAASPANAVKTIIRSLSFTHLGEWIRLCCNGEILSSLWRGIIRHNPCIFLSNREPDLTRWKPLWITRADEQKQTSFCFGLCMSRGPLLILIIQPPGWLQANLVHENSLHEWAIPYFRCFSFFSLFCSLPFFCFFVSFRLVVLQRKNIKVLFRTDKGNR